MHGIGVDSHGRSGGLALLWDKSVCCVLRSFSQYHIDVNVHADDDSSPWRFTEFYGEPDTSKRKSSWNLLASLVAQSPRAWLVGGYFNEILKQSEKQGGFPRPIWQMRDFRLALDKAGLFDLGCEDGVFTWSNRQEVPHTILERLDRVCGNDNWKAKFLHTQSRGIVLSGLPLTISSKRNIEACRLKLTASKRVECGSIKRDIESIEKQIGHLRRQPITAESRQEENNLKAELEDLYQAEEILWKQRAKSHWLKEEDRNTGFFHAYASKTFNRNQIRRLKNSEGQWLDKKQDIAQHISSYFEGSFGRPNPHSMTWIVEWKHYLVKSTQT
ncbi:UNVERIFIED_CONTAM: hypothetical protein Slati_0016800 [Sesamum latifolium]|uniref:Endonuclease/exonuclease/phosphatase n=1 Tax=Sesamum latifolium TaxID=2727402 RepID=A0AAW2Y676_9LAMI